MILKKSYLVAKTFRFSSVPVDITVSQTKNILLLKFGIFCLLRRKEIKPKPTVTNNMLPSSAIWLSQDEELNLSYLYSPETTSVYLSISLYLIISISIC